MTLEGLHHLTAITADVARNVGFYARLLEHEPRRAQLELALTPIVNPRQAS